MKTFAFKPFVFFVLAVVSLLVRQDSNSGTHGRVAYSVLPGAKLVSAVPHDGEETATCLISFGDHFSVATGTTISYSTATSPGSSLFPPAPPITQSGGIYVDGSKQVFRIDQSTRGFQFSFIADYAKGRGYLFRQAMAGGNPDVAFTVSECKTIPLHPLNAGKARGNGQDFNNDSKSGQNRQPGDDVKPVLQPPPLCVPQGYTPSTLESGREDEAGSLRAYFIRGVPAARYTGMDAANASSSFSAYSATDRMEGAEGSGQGAVKSHYYVIQEPDDTGAMRSIPWRLEMHSSNDADWIAAEEEQGSQFLYASAPTRPRAINGAPLSVPNWRFFGQELFGDEVSPFVKGALGADVAGTVDRWHIERLLITTDFYNFIPEPPPASIFEVPAACRRQQAADEVEEAESSSGYTSANSMALSTYLGSSNFTSGSNMNMALVSQRMLIQWSLDPFELMKTPSQNTARDPEPQVTESVKSKRIKPKKLKRKKK